MSWTLAVWTLSDWQRAERAQREKRKCQTLLKTLALHLAQIMFRRIDPKATPLCGLWIAVCFYTFFLTTIYPPVRFFSASSINNPNNTRLERRRSPHSYVDPLHDVDLEQISFADLPLPIQVIENYKLMHSEHALKRNPDLQHRKFAVGLYNCSLEAGNRLHKYLKGT